MNKIVRSVCYFSSNPTEETVAELNKLGSTLAREEFEIQTKRICSADVGAVLNLDAKFASDAYIFGVGSVPRQEIGNHLKALLSARNTSFNLDLSNDEIGPPEVNVLFELIKQKPSLTFNFAYVFNNPPSSPFFPSGNYAEDGFSIGLQPTDLSENCRTLDEWLANIKRVWFEIVNLFQEHQNFLGIDSSVAPLFSGKTSLVGFIRRLGYIFSKSATSDLYLQITKFLKEQNPKPVGLCGVMLPCLEDFELAEEYERGNFGVERNIFLAMHSGLGIDTYPIGVNENPQRVLEILKVVQGLSNKYDKPLSVRFVSDGRTEIGAKTTFNNQYLKDVVVRNL